jgi:hypothetical protein
MKYFLTLPFVLSLYTSLAQTVAIDSAFEVFQSQLKNLSPSDNIEALAATYELKWIEETGMLPSVRKGDGRTLQQVIKEYQKVDYRQRDGSDYGLWDYQVMHIGNRYAVLIANQAVNRVVRIAYYFERAE